jgi:predicted PurR-regulated permease PerM
VVALVSIMVPALIHETQDVKENLPDSAHEIEKLLAQFGIHVELQDRARNIDWNSLISGRSAVNAGQRAVTITVSVITVVVMTAYLLADTPRLGRFVTQFIPEGRREDANGLFVSLTRVVGGYLRGQAITSLAITVFTFILLQVIGVANPLAFAVLAGLADVVPLVGAFVATVPPVAAALQESATQALAVLIGMVLYQQFEDRYLVPRIYGRTLNLPPIIVLVAVLAGAELLGIIGVLLALPLAAAGRVGLDYLLANHLQRSSDAGNTDQILAPDTPREPDDEPEGEAQAPPETARRAPPGPLARRRSARGS